jgi:hypothetical protein
MVITVWKITQVADHIEHQFEVGLVVGMKRSDLPLQQIQQPGEMPVLGMPGIDYIGHVNLPRDAGASMRLA